MTDDNLDRAEKMVADAKEAREAGDELLSMALALYAAFLLDSWARGIDVEGLSAAQP